MITKKRLVGVGLGLLIVTVLAFGTLVTDTVTANKFCLGSNCITTWPSGGGGGTGTVTSFAAGALSPLFTTSVANYTTTPVLSFNLTSAAQNTLLSGPATGGTGTPSYRVMVAADLPASFNAPTSSALAATPAQCAGVQLATGVTANGTANCTASITASSLASGLTTPTPYVFWPGTILGSQLMLRLTIPFSWAVPVALANSTCTSGVAATASTVITLYKNGTAFGTCTFGAGSAAGSLASSAGAGFNGTSDVLTVSNQSTADATLANVSLAIYGTH